MKDAFESGQTPLYDELEAKWTGENYQRAICDLYWTVTQTATGQEWFEDDEGNEVFPEELESQEETQYSPGGYIGQFPELHKAIFEDRTYCPVSNVAVVRPKRKFKLFGRNQGTNGTL